MTEQAKIVDNRTNKDRPALGYVVCTDSMLSGWGQAPGRSLYALAIETAEDLKAVTNNADARSDMKRPRHVMTMTADGLPRVQLRAGDHLKIVDRGQAARWYKDGAFIEH